MLLGMLGRNPVFFCFTAQSIQKSVSELVGNHLTSALQQRKLFNSCLLAKLYIYFASSVVVPTGIAVSKGGHSLMNTTTFTKQQWQEHQLTVLTTLINYNQQYI